MADTESFMPGKYVKDGEWVKCVVCGSRWPVAKTYKINEEESICVDRERCRKFLRISLEVGK